MRSKLYGYGINGTDYGCLRKTKLEAINDFLEDNKKNLKDPTVFFIGEFNKVKFTPKVKAELILNDIQKEIDSNPQLKSVKYFEELTEEKKRKNGEEFISFFKYLAK